MTYSYDRTAGTPLARPNTPWGKADHVIEIIRGVRWVSTPGHGGLGVAKGVANKLLSWAAQRLGDFQGGYYWYEEDVQCAIPFYEHPEWARASGLSSVDKNRFEEDIRRSYPKYFEYLDDGKRSPPKLTVGMKLKVLGETKFPTAPFSGGDIVQVERVTSSSFVIRVPGVVGLFKLPLGYYYGHGYNAAKFFEAVD